MTSSYLESKILDLEARLRAKSELNKNGNSSPDLSNGFGSRPGSGRRPRDLGNVTPNSGRKPYDFPASTRATSEIDAKMKEIMKMSGILIINGKKYVTSINDLEHLGELGSGTCGHVVKMRHCPSNSIIAVKQMRWSGDAEENKRIYRDLEVVLKCHGCPFIVSCYGCFITDADVWICMELMSTSFDKLTKFVGAPLPEDIIGRVAHGTVHALHYLKERHDVMHNDIKPSNILLDADGNVKLCDFGISGHLVNSKAKSGNAGCAAYMAPERISPGIPGGYDVRADVWSLGITLVELATGAYPYKGCKSDFEVLTSILTDEPPRLPNNNFSAEFHSFVEACLRKDYHQRPKYNKLLEHPFLLRYSSRHVDVAAWFAQVQRVSRSAEKVQLTNAANRSTTIGNRKKESKSKVESEGFKSIWSSIIRSPLFHRRKKSHESPPILVTSPPAPARSWIPQPSPPLTPPSPPQELPPQVAGNTSPLVLQRFLHQQMQHMNSRRLNRSSSMSPTLRQFDTLAQELKNLRLDHGPIRRNTSPSPEPPPRINKMVSPLLLRRMAYNNAPEAYFSTSVNFQRYGIPPQPPPRKKSIESKSVPCSPIPNHRYFKSPPWYPMDRS